MTSTSYTRFQRTGKGQSRHVHNEEGRRPAFFFPGIHNITPLDQFLKMGLSSLRPKEEIARHFGAPAGSFLEKLLVQLCEDRFLRALWRVLESGE